MTRPLNLVWRRKALDSLMEATFIREVLFAGVRRPIRWIALEDGDDLPMLDDILIVSFGDPADYLKALRDRGLHNIGLFHLGDERGENSIEAYALADYVLRHYHFPERLRAGKAGGGAEVLWVPNGWGRGIGPCDAARHLPFSERRVPLFFSGFVGDAGRRIDERDDMLAALKENAVPALISLTGGFAQGFSGPAFAAHLGNTRFALAPSGNSPETIRLYDSLELRAVPVLLDKSWLHAEDGIAALGPPPFIRLKDWAAAPAALAPYLGDTSAAEQSGEDLRRDAVSWWSRFKVHLAERVADTIERTFTKVWES